MSPRANCADCGRRRVLDEEHRCRTCTAAPVTGVLSVIQHHVTDQRGSQIRRRVYPELRISPPYLRAAGMRVHDRVRVTTGPEEIVIRRRQT